MINPEQFLKDYNEFSEYYGKRAIEYHLSINAFHYEVSFEPMWFEASKNTIEFDIYDPFYGATLVNIPKDVLFLSENDWEKYIIDKRLSIRAEEELYKQEQIIKKHQQYEKLKKELGYE